MNYLNRKMNYFLALVQRKNKCLVVQICNKYEQMWKQKMTWYMNIIFTINSSWEFEIDHSKTILNEVHLTILTV